MRIEVRRAADRFESRGPGTGSRHSLSFGRHYDPRNVSFGLLLAVNEERLDPGAGFARHPHAGVEIVTWVLSGELRHEDSAGGSGVVRPGMVQRLYAGSGVDHGERASPAGPVRLVQMWLAADPPAGPPEYEVGRLGLPTPSAPLPTGRLLPVAAARAGAPVHLRQQAATLSAALVAPYGSVVLPPEPFLHVQVTAGRLRLAGHDLAEMDTVRVTDAEQLALSAAAAGGQALVWTMSRELRPPISHGESAAPDA